MRSFIIPVDRLSTALEAYLETYLQQFGKTVKDLPYQPTEDDLLIVVQTLIDDEINHRLKWAKSTRNLDMILERFFPSLVQNDEEVIEMDFEGDVIELVRDDILQLINTLIPENSWKIWHSRLLARDLILEEGEDYRIADWTARFARGEITLND